MRVVSVSGVLPDHRYPQDEITEAFLQTMLRGTADAGMVRRLHANAGAAQLHRG